MVDLGDDLNVDDGDTLIFLHDLHLESALLISELRSCQQLHEKGDIFLSNFHGDLDMCSIALLSVPIESSLSPFKCIYCHPTVHLLGRTGNV